MSYWTSFHLAIVNKIFLLCHIALEARALHLRSCFIILQFNYVPVRLVCRLLPRVAAVCSHRVKQNRARRYRASFLRFYANRKKQSSSQISNLGYFLPCPVAISLPSSFSLFYPLLRFPDNHLVFLSSFEQMRWCHYCCCGFRHLRLGLTLYCGGLWGWNTSPHNDTVAMDGCKFAASLQLKI